MLYTHKKSGGVATILSIREDSKRASRYGCIVVDPTTNKVKHFVEKPTTFISELVSCGVYLFSKELFVHINEAMEIRNAKDAEYGFDLAQFPQNQSLAASNAALSHRTAERVQFEQDVMPVLTEKKVLYAHIMNEDDFWMPIKTGSSTITANRQYLQYFLQAHPRRLSTPANTPLMKSPAQTPVGLGFGSGPEIVAPVFIHSTAVIHPSAKIGPNVFIGPRALIGRGVRIRDALILDGVEVKNESCILNAVVGWESKIGQWTRIEGSTQQEQNEGEATRKGLKIPSAVILGKGVTVVDEVIIRDCIVLPHKELRSSFQREILM
ncbi:hypothetical protein HDV02_000710 [Globomyces sp. JEL0801]|nr:hypothetical protein HDV02_000710 [Globomyces sp. JEL0801]